MVLKYLFRAKILKASNSVHYLRHLKFSASGWTFGVGVFQFENRKYLIVNLG